MGANAAASLSQITPSASVWNVGFSRLELGGFDELLLDSELGRGALFDSEVDAAEEYVTWLLVSHRGFRLWMIPVSKEVCRFV